MNVETDMTSLVLVEVGNKEEVLPSLLMNDIPSEPDDEPSLLTGNAEM